MRSITLRNLLRCLKGDSVNKTQGVTVGAILAAGLMMRPTGQGTSTAVPLRPASLAAAAAAQGYEKSEEGPWLASCKYWEPARSIDGEPKKENTELTIAISGQGVDKKSSKNFRVNSQVSEVVGKEANDCSTATSNDAGAIADDRLTRWGIPSTLPGGRVPEIHALVASFPDPLHTHLALEFDREVDALVQAAGDNGYVPSYFWLPWLKRGGSQREDTSLSKEGLDELAKREQEPGLIIFKHVPQPGESDYPQTSYSKVIYVFIITQAPTLGTDGTQLARTLLYESELKHVDAKISFSMKSGNKLVILGASSSGAIASLRQGIERGHEFLKQELGMDFSFEVLGTTSTILASDLSTRQLPGGPSIQFHSFGHNSAFETTQFRGLLDSSDYPSHRVALLIEDSTAYGAATTDLSKKPEDWSTLDIIRFPRGVSLLRNAHPENGETDNQGKSAPSPYLHLSLRDPGADDSVPQFSPEHTPLSQEAQLMAIGRQLQRNNTQFIIIEASDVLDQIFLAQFLHRACPDARLVFFVSDLLFERDTEDVPFVGTITFNPYGLIGLTGSSKGGSVRAFSDAYGEAYYNAASYMFHDGVTPPLELSNYRDPFALDSFQHASLWATIVGIDGYYPLGIVNQCASNSENILPAFDSKFQPFNCSSPPAGTVQTSSSSEKSFLSKISLFFNFESKQYEDRPYRYPALTWYVLCITISLLCLVHAFAVSFPNYWSPFTRDLAIDQGDHRHRRSMYIHIGTTVLFCMGMVTAYPLFPTFRVIHPEWKSATYSLITLMFSLIAFLLTLRKTWKHLGWQKASDEYTSGMSEREKARIKLDKNFPLFFNVLALFALILIPFAWIGTCETEIVNGTNRHLGIFFSYRCLHPLSGVSPLMPMLLVLMGWYLWAVLQTLRLRFSKKTRPYLPGINDKTNPHAMPAGENSYPLYVSDAALSSPGGAINNHLYKYITCLLITREWLKRVVNQPKMWLAPWMLAFYLGLYCFVIFALRIRSPESFLLQPGRLPTWYEALLGTLFYPLIMVALAGWLRTMLVWSSLKRGVLEQLEQLPIRYAFTRLKGTGWMVMMRQGGLAEQWRDMARSTESIRQMCHDEDLLNSFDCKMNGQKVDGKDSLGKIRGRLEDEITKLLSRLGPQSPAEEQKHHSPDDAQCGLDHMHAIELIYSEFSDALLSCVLIPHWEKVRTGVVESDVIDELPIKARSSNKDKDEAEHRLHQQLLLHTGPIAEEPKYIQVAEEFLAIRYVSLIRGVLVNMRYLLIFISIVFMLTIVAWNSYPFEPRLWVNEAFTGLLVLLGAGVIWVFAQMHRDPLLSRITDTNANELGFDFYLRIITFGAGPVLAWLAYQFPDIGGGIFRLIQPGLEVLK